MVPSGETESCGGIGVLPPTGSTCIPFSSETITETECVFPVVIAANVVADVVNCFKRAVSSTGLLMNSSNSCTWFFIYLHHFTVSIRSIKIIYDCFNWC